MIETLLHIWTLFYSILLALFVFGVTVLVHEFGHYLVARRCGLVVKTFSIGFGRAIFKWERDGIVYKIGWIPFGGYVALPQLDPVGMETIQGGAGGETYAVVSPWKKIVVAFAGSAGNILFAVLLALAIWLIPGDEAGSKLLPVLGSVDETSEAFAAGLRRGDEITAVDGKVVDSWYDFNVELLLKNSDAVTLNILRTTGADVVIVPVVQDDDGMRSIAGIQPAIPCLFGQVTPDSPAARGGVLAGDTALVFNGVPLLDWIQFTELVQQTTPGEPVSLIVERRAEPVELTVIPERSEEGGRILIGVRLGGGSLPWMHHKNPIDQLRYDASAIFRVLKALVTPAEAKQAAGGLGGPIAIFSMLAVSVKTGLLNTLGLIRFLNINLAVLNLLPIPVLDGGHILFSLWEGITRRKVNAKIQIALINIFALLLVGSMIFLSIRDVDRGIRLHNTTQSEPAGGK